VSMVGSKVHFKCPPQSFHLRIEVATRCDRGEN
jgi:hypothetical protein